MQAEKIIIEGMITQIAFHNPETNFGVVWVETKTINHEPVVTEVQVVGLMPELYQQEDIRVEGYWQQHQTYGKQLRIQNITRRMPVSIEGIERFLGSGLLKGVGKRTAQRIVEHFGAETLEVLDSPTAVNRLKEINKISESRAEMIVKAWREQRQSADDLMFLRQYEIGAAMAMKIQKYYGERNQSILEIFENNPYQLIYDIDGIGFLTADRIAQQVGISPDSPERFKAAFMHILDKAVVEGHTFLPQTELLEKCTELLRVIAPEEIETALAVLIKERRVILKEIPDYKQDDKLVPAIYARILYRMEEGGAERFVEQLKAKPLAHFMNRSNATWSRFLQDLGSQHNISLTDQQAEAVKIALTHKISILTGGPGTGKTTTLQMLIIALETERVNYLLASPTGRAAKRLNQATNRIAMTIHRMLGYSFEFRGFLMDAENPLATEFVIIDESSMLDIHLFYALMQALPPEAHVLLVGDVDQLPSVGAGDVLRDIIRSRVCPVTRLNTIFRQAAGSAIIQNAHRINRGEPPLLDNTYEDFFFFNVENPRDANAMLVDVVMHRIPQKFNYDPHSDIQVLAPMYRSLVGVDALNASLQAKLNPPQPDLKEYQQRGMIFREGDRVMQTRNDYSKSVFNGDIGHILEIDLANNNLEVLMDGNLLTYSTTDLQDLTLAYACSVHRSQGSEYPVVVMPILTQHYMMLQRNLLYTAVTRAKELVVLVGTRKAVSIAVNNNKESQRWTALEWFINQHLNEK